MQLFKYVLTKSVYMYIYNWNIQCRRSTKCIP